MHRNNIRERLKNYVGRWPTESAAVDRYTEFVNVNPDCFERSLGIGHVTGSAWLVNPAGSHVLLTHHRKLNRWLQVGGHADGEVNVLNVARREAREESGLPCVTPLRNEIFDIDIHLIPARKDESAHYHYDCRFVMQAQRDDYTVSDESHDLAWIEIAALKELTSEESLLRMAEKWNQRFD